MSTRRFHRSFSSNSPLHSSFRRSRHADHATTTRDASQPLHYSTTRFEPDEDEANASSGAAATVKVLPFSEDSSANSSSRRLTSSSRRTHFGRRTADAYRPTISSSHRNDSDYATPLRKAPVAPVSHSHRSSIGNQYSSNARSDNSHKSPRSPFGSMNRRSSRYGASPTSQYHHGSGTTMTHSHGHSVGHHSAPVSDHPASLHSNPNNNQIATISASLPSSQLVKRTRYNQRQFAHSLHEELLRSESQRQDAILYSEKLQVQLDMQREENDKLGKLISSLQRELARAGKQAAESVVGTIQKQFDNQSKSMMQQMELKLSRMQEVLLSEGGSSRETREMNNRVANVESNQERQFTTLESLNDKLSQFISQQEHELSNPRTLTNIESVRNRISTLMRRDFADLQQTIEQLQDQMSALRDEFDREQANFVDQWKGTLESLSHENGELTHRLTESERECSELHSEVDQLTISLRQSESRAEHYVKLANHASEIAELKSKSSGSSSSSKTTATEAPPPASSLRREDANLLKQKLESLEQENQRLISYQDELVQQLEHVTKQRDRANEKVEILESETQEERSSYESQIRSLRQELNNSQSPNRALEEELSSLQRQLKQKEKQLTDVTTRYNQTESQLQHTKHELNLGSDQHVKRIHALQQEVQSLKRELSSQEHENDTLRSDYNRAREEEKRLRKVVQQQSDSISHLQTQVELLKTDQVQNRVGETLRRTSMGSRASVLKTPLKGDHQ